MPCPRTQKPQDNAPALCYDVGIAHPRSLLCVASRCERMHYRLSQYTGLCPSPLHYIPLSAEKEEKRELKAEMLALMPPPEEREQKTAPNQIKPPRLVSKTAWSLIAPAHQKSNLPLFFSHDILLKPVWVALLRSVQTVLTPSHRSRGINQTGTGTSHETDFAFLTTVVCHRDAGKW